MSDGDHDIRSSPTLGERLTRQFRQWQPRRPVSLYLMVAMLVALLLGGQVVYVRDDPKKFAFLLSLYFIFFLVVIVRATLEFFDVIRQHVREREGLFRETFTEDGFAAELGQRVGEHDAESWPDV